MKLISFEKPGLKLGTYTIKVTQNIEIKSSSINKDFTSTQKIAIVGERFTLNPHDIHMLYPSENGIHNFSYVLPHIVMNNEFCPWERKVSSSDRDTPYLALLLFHEDEEFSSQSMTLSALKGKINLTDSELEVSDNENDKINVIEVDKELLQKIMPTVEELKCLTHVEKTDKKRSVVMSNRLPFKGGETTACLVSLEKRFVNGSFAFDSEGASISLVLLKKWNFRDIKFYSTQNIVESSSDISKPIINKLKENKRTYRGKAKFAKQIEKALTGLEPNERVQVKEAIFNESIDDSPVFMRLLTALSVQAMAMPKGDKDAYLQKATVPLVHHLRTGDKSISWYRGVLATGKRTGTSPNISFPVKVADELLFFDKEYQMFDVSYAAAWELGKLLCLKNIDIASELLITKKKQALLESLGKQGLQENDLLPIQIDKSKIEFSTILQNWFKGLKKLEKIPLNYLLADEQLVEEESLRFFVLDEFWIKCLIDGALQVGGEIPRSVRTEFNDLRETETYSGIVLRSEIQLIWPNLTVMVNKQKPIKVHRLTVDTVLYLFKGLIDNVEIKQAPEALHFEVDSKTTLPYKDEAKRVLNIAVLGEGKDSAEFAKECMAKPRGIKFLRGLV